MKTILPEIHGHRGARGLSPENSLVAIRTGIKSGCTAIEVDLCVSADNQLIIHHDPILPPWLVKDQYGKWIKDGIAVRSLPLSTLKEFDIGQIDSDSEYGRRYPQQVPVPGTRIPTLTEYVELTEQMEADIIFNLELKSTPYQPEITAEKEQYIELIVNQLNQHQIIEKTFLQSFDWRLVIGAQLLIPNLKTGLLTDQQANANPQSPIPGKPTLWTNGMDLGDFSNLPEMIKTAGGDVWSCNSRDTTIENIQTAHDNDLEVYVWTVNNLKDMQKMIDYGVDAITTDYPDRLFQLLQVAKTKE